MDHQEDLPHFIHIFQQFPRQVPGLLDMLDEDELEHLPGLMLRIGLQQTALTKAILRGDYPEAEKIIEETTDPELLNEGLQQETPLNIVLNGPSGPYQQPRNLRIAKLLLENGANPNLRIPNPDMESACESPLELLLKHYIRLGEMFGLPGGLNCRDSYSTAEETELMDTIGINGELFGISPQTMIAQTRELLLYCLDRGGDCNLPTTDATRTIYHVAVLAPVLDSDLIQHMLELGANVNHADVHNTTPLMDVISLGQEDRTLVELDRFSRNSRSPMLDNQNCSLQSALFRAAFKGQRRVVNRLLDLGASPGLMARVELCRDSASHNRWPRRLTGVPGILAPLLGNSPCTTGFLRPRKSRRSARYESEVPDFKMSVADKAMLSAISPLVDSGRFSTDCVTDKLFSLLTSSTDHPTVGNSKNVESKAVLHLMFGQTTAGLRQLAVRSILKSALFSSSPQETNERLKKVCERRGITIFPIFIKPSETSTSEAMIAHDFLLETNSELELSYGHHDLDLLEDSSLEPATPSGDRLEEAWAQLDRVTRSLEGSLPAEVPGGQAGAVRDRMSANYTSLTSGISHRAASLSNMATSGLSRLASGFSSAASDISFGAVSPVNQTLDPWTPLTPDETASPAVDRGSGLTYESGRSDLSQKEGDKLDSNEQLGQQCQGMLESLDEQCADWERRLNRLSHAIGASNTSHPPATSSDPSLPSPTPTQSSYLPTSRPSQPSHLPPAPSPHPSELPPDRSHLPPTPTPSLEDDWRSWSNLRLSDISTLPPCDRMVRLREMMRSELRGSDLSTEQRRNIADYLPNRTDEEIRRQLNGEVPLHNVDSRQVDRSEVGRRLEIELMKQKSIHAGTDEYIAEVTTLLAETTMADQVVPDQPRRRLDENWSLGSNKNLEAGDLTTELPDGATGKIATEPCSHTVEIVQSLNVNVNVDLNISEHSYSPPSAALNTQKHMISDSHTGGVTEQLSADLSDLLTIDIPQHSELELSIIEIQPHDEEGPYSQRQFEGLNADRRRGSCEAISAHRVSTAIPELHEESSTDLSDFNGQTSTESGGRTTNQQETDTEEVTDSDSDTWGGTFSLKHICCRKDDSSATEATVISRLNPQMLDALTDDLGVPTSLRPCFSLEAARLQLAAILYHHRAISCDRNCEGDESDENDDDDVDDDEYDVGWEVNSSSRSESELSDSSSTLSSSSNVSVRSNFGSHVADTGSVVRTLSWRSSSSEEDWLEDREDMIRLRHFLSGSPPPDWNHSTSSESDD